MSPAVLTQAVSRLEKVQLRFCKLSPSHLKSLLNQMADGKCFKLKHLNLSYNDMCRVPSELLVAAIQRLERVNLGGSALTTEQLHSLFSDLAEGNCSKLKHLDLNNNDMSQIPSELLVAATQRLESVDFIQSRLTTEQLMALYEMVAERMSGSLKEIIIIAIDLSMVPSSLIQRAKLNKSVSIRVRRVIIADY